MSTTFKRPQSNGLKAPVTGLVGCVFKRIKSMDTNLIISFLRNPYGKSPEEMREVRLAAANEIEQWKNAYENMRDWAIQCGVDVDTYSQT